MSAAIPQIGGIVRSARESLGLTQSELARKTSVSKHTILMVENNQRYPSFEVLYRLVHALDISADLIVCPHRLTCTPEQERFIREFLSCDDREQKILEKLFRCLLRALRQDVPEKQD
jgi:transcriptional regulator with XRE-family HTH domain